MRVAVLGSTGQLGQDLVEMLQQSGKFDVTSLGHDEADCTEAESIRNAVVHARPQALINCAAFVRVDDCEDHAHDAFEVNALGALNVARACAEIDATCVSREHGLCFRWSGEQSLCRIGCYFPD